MYSGSSVLQYAFKHKYNLFHPSLYLFFFVRVHVSIYISRNETKFQLYSTMHSNALKLICWLYANRMCIQIGIYHIVCYEMRWVLSIFAYMKRTYLLLDVFMQILRSGYIHSTYIVMLLLFATDATAAVSATELGKTQIYSPFCTI